MRYQNVYIHVPFCRSKCDYCCFYSIPHPKEEFFDAYLDKLDHDLAGTVFADKLDTLYIGGGTPTLMNEEKMEIFLKLLRKRLPLAETTEISIECNPGSITAAKAEQVKNFANRLSVGIQSFNPRFRQIIGRECSDCEIKTTLDLLNGCNLSLDLIYSIPSQTMQDWLDDLKLAVQMKVKHISCYALTLEEGTVLAERTETSTVDEELSAEMWEETGKVLNTAGLKRYEISNYAVPGFECRHNRNVWYGKAYIGFGPAAASFDGKDRWTQPCSLKQWLNNSDVEYDIISPESRAMEVFVTGLRTTNGWTKEKWTETDLTNSTAWDKLLEKATNNFFVCDESNIKLNENGLLFWDSVAQDII